MPLLQPKRTTGALVTAGGMAVLDNVAVIINEKLMRKITRGQIEAVGTKINTSHLKIKHYIQIYLYKL